MADLGFKGLGEMLGSVVSNTRSDSIKMINIDELHDSEDNFFELNRIEELAESILLQGGVKENLIVRKLESGGYEVISGHRRKAAVKYLIDKGENVAHMLPCLEEEYSTDDEKMLNLIMMNVSQRQLSDSELFKSYEQINDILKRKKENGEKFGKLREKIAESLGVSPAQVQKLQNVDNHAIHEIKEAVISGDVSLSTANAIAKLDSEEQKKLAEGNLSELKTKDVKKIQDDTVKRVDTDISTEEKHEEYTDQSVEKVDTSINLSDGTSIAENKSTASSVSRQEYMLEMMSECGLEADAWSNAACRGYCIKAMQKADMDDEQIRKVLSCFNGVFDFISVEQAEKIYQNY